ncbi:heterodisulfide reductase subunit C [Candidatus Desantisbacteria bacterium CG_4_10_14_3_um_filter_40_18]|uniref:Heterodisulfide reductase subunit C n=2 Tax=unclassified Candidatus Desantisiibacteriota TaxID=3106372 RepID=A0A2M7P4Q7_9BACT|nr:MAG: heterodisulfide reductase subunit C [Candidatus Desantisbacteria bacterium CG23_combo_of_CG06-09_8_20_14_all_40_23]PIY20610.1 MAG: heterodisulfide reductase subunit C [Candidatus Desantisbacteria bacterium CG_4_10_14_3_um_filter_40_18]
MMQKLLINNNILKFKEDIEGLSKQRISNCYQCGKCTAGCPVAFAMDYPPNQVIRMIQLGLRNEVMSSHAPWFCASCETCTTRCPREIDLARIMDSLRIIAQAENKVSVREVPILNQIFLKSIELTGRVYEVGVIGAYNFFSLNPFKDIPLGIKMFLKGKLNLMPHSAGNFRGLFKRIREKSCDRN